MIDWFLQGGFLMWPVLVAGLIALALAAHAGRRLSVDDATTVVARRIRGRIDAVLFWGVFAALVGLLGTLGGVGQLARTASRAGGDLPAEVIWDGLRVTLPTFVLGLTVLLVSLGLWFGLRAVHRRRVGAADA